MQNVAYGVGKPTDERKETRYGSDNIVYLRLRNAEEDNEPLGSGSGYTARRELYAVGLRSRGKRGYRRTLRRGLRDSVAKPVAW
jgi:hypothetical protein